MKIIEILREAVNSAFKIKNNLTYQTLDQFIKSNNDQEIDEAQKGLGAKMRSINQDELDSYLNRAKNKDKDKSDKFKMPYVHNSSIKIKDENARTYDQDALKKIITTRPSKIIQQNQKMVHSDGSTSIFINIGLPALKGLAVNEDTGEFVIVDTCPGAGACQTFCYAMKGSYVLFKGVWEHLSKVLNFLLNDPDGFAVKLSSELQAIQQKYPDTKLTVRWHDAGDFFSPEYLELAYDIARNFPTVDFYAYTKLANVAQGAKPDNFLMNFSSGAKRSEEKQINFVKDKHSIMVPKKLFFDLIKREGNSIKLIKDEQGRMQFRDHAALNEFKHRLADTYKLELPSILTYDEMTAIPVSNDPKYNVIVMPGDGDESASRKDVLGTYLLFH